MITRPAVLPYLAPPPAAAPAPALPRALPQSTPSFSETVRDTRQAWSHQGKKLGKLAAVGLGQTVLPLSLAIHYPVLIPILLNPASMVAGLLLLSLEEKHIGVGKHVGGLVGSAAGLAAGRAKAVYRKVRPAAEPPEKVQLRQQAPTGKPPREALLPTMVHAAERKLLGRVPERTRTVEICENIGATATTLAGAYLLPTIATHLGVGDTTSLVTNSLIGIVGGLILGGVAENAFGIGRGLGEVVGQGLSAAGVRGKTAAAPDPNPKKASVLGKAFMQLNHAIADSIIPTLVDGASLTNRLFAEEPRQSMGFADRPAPKVNRERLIDNFIKLAGINGPSYKEGPVADEATKQLKDLGFSVERRPDHTLIGTLPGTVADAPTVMLSAHQDTVGPTDPNAIRRDDKKIYTTEGHILGGDDRAGMAEILEGVRTVLEQGMPRPEIKVVFTVSEEVGLKGAARLAPEDISTRPTLGFVMDSTNIRDINLTNDAVIVAPRSIKYQYSQEEPVVQVAFRSMAEAGCKPRPLHCPIMTGAGTDANTPAFNSKNIRSIALGAGETDMHTVLENISINDLEQAAKHVVGVITNSCDLKVQGDQVVPRFPLH